MIEFSKKNILIIGASSGIGAETARVLASCGARVILVARREHELEAICKEIGVEKSSYYVADVSDVAVVSDLVTRIVNENGKLDGLVYAAGMVDDVPLKFLDSDRLQKTFAVNYFSFIEFVRQVSQKKNYSPGMRIVAVSSVAALKGEKAHTSYSASKAAMDASIRCLAKELWDKGIALNSVQPSMIRTRMYDDFLDKVGDEERANESLKRSQYAGVGETEDVANAIAYLLSQEASFVTGISLPIDGGASTS